MYGTCSFSIVILIYFNIVKWFSRVKVVNYTDNKVYSWINSALNKILLY